MMSDLFCDHCKQAVRYGKYDPEAEKPQPGDYLMVGIRRLGVGYGRNCGYQSICVYTRCLDAWNATNGNKTPAAQPALS